MKRHIWLLALAVAVGMLLSTYADQRVNGQAPDTAVTTLKGEVVDICIVS